MSDKIVITNITEKNKGSLILQCDVELVPWGIILKEVRYFEKGQNAWVGMPSRSWKEGEEWMHKDLVVFKENAVRERFRKAICDEIREIIKDGIPQEEPFQEKEECPF